jgi:hypothetical protein
MITKTLGEGLCFGSSGGGGLPNPSEPLAAKQDHFKTLFVDGTVYV